MPIRFHLDEHIDSAIADGHRRRGIDVTTSAEAGLRAAQDEGHIAFALAETRVIVTKDDDFLSYAGKGAQHAGIVYTKQGRRTVGELLDWLIIIHGCLTPEEMQNHIEYI